MKNACLSSALLLALTTAWSSPSQGAEVTRNYISHGVANCQSALPVFDGLVRKRPLAMVNEGTSNVFVTCDFESLPYGSLKVTAVRIYLSNRGSTSTSIGCTLVQGFGRSVFAKPSPNRSPCPRTRLTR